MRFFSVHDFEEYNEVILIVISDNGCDFLCLQCRYLTFCVTAPSLIEEMTSFIRRGVARFTFHLIYKFTHKIPIFLILNADNTFISL